MIYEKQLRFKRNRVNLYRKKIKVTLTRAGLLEFFRQLKIPRGQVSESADGMYDVTFECDIMELLGVSVETDNDVRSRIKSQRDAALRYVQLSEASPIDREIEEFLSRTSEASE